MAEEKRQLKTDKLKSLRLEQYGRLVENGITAKVMQLATFETTTAPNSFMIVRKTRVGDMTDEEWDANPRLDDVFNIYGGSFTGLSKVVQLQLLEPVDDLGSFDPNANVMSVGIIEGGSEFLIQGLAGPDEHVLKTLVLSLEESAEKGIDICKKRLVADQPLGYVQPGIPLV